MNSLGRSLTLRIARKDIQFSNATRAEEVTDDRTEWVKSGGYIQLHELDPTRSQVA